MFGHAASSAGQCPSRILFSALPFERSTMRTTVSSPAGSPVVRPTSSPKGRYPFSFYFLMVTIVISLLYIIGLLFIV